MNPVELARRQVCAKHEGDCAETTLDEKRHATIWCLAHTPRACRTIEFMQGDVTNCPKNLWAALANTASDSDHARIGATHTAGRPARVDKRGCGGCKQKLLIAMQRQIGGKTVKAAIFIVLDTKPGTSTTEIPRAEKLAILQKCYQSCTFEGFPIVLVASGDSPGVEAVRAAVPNTALYGVWGEFDRQRGECALGLRILAEAQAMGVDWIVKIAADTYHPSPGWATKLIEAGEAAGAELVSTAHHRPDWVTTQCYAVRPDFMRRTFPPMDADYGRIGIEAQWGERIAAAGLTGKWLKPAAIHIQTDGTDNLAPANPDTTYIHAHCLASTASWKPVDSSITPDLKMKVSIVIPARNEVSLNPNRGNVPLLTDTWNSIRETSPADNLPEGILIDDGSDKPLPACDYPGLRIIRNATSLGVDPARNIGIKAATGDVVGILDGHMRVQNVDLTPCIHGLQKLATLARDRNALVCGRCTHLEMPTHNGNPPMVGGRIIPLTDPKSTLAQGWYDPMPPHGVHQVNAVFGASYFATRDLWKKLHYFIECCHPWGFSEEGLSLKAAFLGVPILACGDVTVSHWFRAHGPHLFPVDDRVNFINRMRVLKVTFTDKTFNEVWLPRLKASVWDQDYESALVAPALLAERDAFQAVKTVSDAAVMQDIFKVTI